MNDITPKLTHQKAQNLYIAVISVMVLIGSTPVGTFITTNPLRPTYDITLNNGLVVVGPLLCLCADCNSSLFPLQNDCGHLARRPNLA